MKIKDIRQEERIVNGEQVRVTVVEREPTPEEQLEQRIAVLEARVAALEAKLERKQRGDPPCPGLKSQATATS